MKYLADCFNCKKRLSSLNLKVLVYSVVLGLFLMSLFSGKSNVVLKAIAVSPSEQYVACFGNGEGYKIHCFRADGTLAFAYDIPLEISSGGNCTLWFENDVLCALFYRTNRIVSFSMDGTLLGIDDNTTEETPPEYPSFSYRSHQYVYDGNEISVVYDTGGFFGYWIFGAERYLAITPKNKGTIIVMTWIAQNP